MTECINIATLFIVLSFNSVILEFSFNFSNETLSSTTLYDSLLCSLNSVKHILSGNAFSKAELALGIHEKVIHSYIQLCLRRVCSGPSFTDFQFRTIQKQQNINSFKASF